MSAAKIAVRVATVRARTSCRRLVRGSSSSVRFRGNAINSSSTRPARDRGRRRGPRPRERRAARRQRRKPRASSRRSPFSPLRLCTRDSGDLDPCHQPTASLGGGIWEPARDGPRSPLLRPRASAAGCRHRETGLPAGRSAPARGRRRKSRANGRKGMREGTGRAASPGRGLPAVTTAPIWRGRPRRCGAGRPPVSWSAVPRSGEGAIVRAGTGRRGFRADDRHEKLKASASMPKQSSRVVDHVSTAALTASSAHLSLSGAPGRRS
jgi:hypothetical protein